MCVGDALERKAFLSWLFNNPWSVEFATSYLNLLKTLWDPAKRIKISVSTTEEFRVPNANEYPCARDVQDHVALSTRIWFQPFLHFRAREDGAISGLNWKQFYPFSSLFSASRISFVIYYRFRLFNEGFHETWRAKKLKHVKRRTSSRKQRRWLLISFSASPEKEFLVQ